MSGYYLDDLNVGDEFRSYGRTITETDIVNFTCLAGIKVPIFIDEEFARTTSYGGRIVPGLLTAAISIGMMEEVLGPSLIAGLELNGFKFSFPVRPGDTLQTIVAVEDKKLLSDQMRGLFFGRIRVNNQNKIQVLEFTQKLMMWRSPNKSGTG
ncbi:MaoC family dehydratase [Acidocella sp.]|uniref:MaoC family dehydratase n=1 Tax=Acidocella sp. TaxID=50710 RepID=UPI002621CB35|nr:MaoC family dehydratase [Acidocella sp.]